jgi:hypothetical protein
MSSTTGTALTLGISSLTVLYLSFALYQRWLSPLSRVPGPFLASITPFWIAYRYWRQDWHLYVQELHKKYGPIVRIAPDTVSVGDPEAIKAVYCRYRYATARLSS